MNIMTLVGKKLEKQTTVFLSILIVTFLAASNVLSADYDNNISYRNGEKMKLQSKIGVVVELSGNGADFEVVDMVGNGETAFKVNRVADGLKSLEVGGESVSNLVVEIAEDVYRRSGGGGIDARLVALEGEVARLTATITNLQRSVATIQERIDTPPTVGNVGARQRYPWNGLVDITFTIADAGNDGNGE